MAKNKRTKRRKANWTKYNWLKTTKDQKNENKTKDQKNKNKTRLILSIGTL